MSLNDPDCMWTEKQAAQYLGLSVKFLQQDRAGGRRIPYAKLGRAVRYDPNDIKAHVEKCKVRTNGSE